MEDNEETFTLTLSNAMGAAIGDGDATGTILNTESPPVDSNALTGSFADVPTEHDGSAALTLRLQFSEPVGVSYATLRVDGAGRRSGEVNVGPVAPGGSDSPPGDNRSRLPGGGSPSQRP